MGNKPGPPLKPFNQLSAAGKSQRKNPTAHRKYNNEKGKEESEKKDRVEHNRERRKRNIYGKMKPGGQVLSRKKNGKFSLMIQKRNAAANGSGNRSRYAD